MSEIRKFPKRGIERIEIPVKDSDLWEANDYGRKIISKYLPGILKTHQDNADKVSFFYNYFKGEQDVYNKERLYQKDQDNNNKIVENHAYRQVNFKTGFLIGEKRVYTTKDGTSSDDLTYLERYLTDVDFWAKDKDLKEWIFATGIGTTHCEPRTDIIIKTGELDALGNPIVRYRNKQEGFDITKQAPFNFEVIKPTENFVVYSSGRRKEPWFCVSIVEVDVGKGDEIILKKQLQIETRYATFTTKSEMDFIGLEELSFAIPKTTWVLPTNKVVSIIDFASNNCIGIM